MMIANHIHDALAQVRELQKKILVRPRTEISLSESGREKFVEYLKALEEALKKAAEAVSTSSENVRESLFAVKPALQG